MATGSTNALPYKVDARPTKNSTNLVQSGGVHDRLLPFIRESKATVSITWTNLGSNTTASAYSLPSYTIKDLEFDEHGWLTKLRSSSGGTSGSRTYRVKGTVDYNNISISALDFVRLPSNVNGYLVGKIHTGTNITGLSASNTYLSLADYPSIKIDIEDGVPTSYSMLTTPTIWTAWNSELSGTKSYNLPLMFNSTNSEYSANLTFS